MPNCTCFEPSTSKHKCLACEGQHIAVEAVSKDNDLPQIRKSVQAYPVGYGGVSGSEKPENNTKEKPQSFSTQITSWHS